MAPIYQTQPQPKAAPQQIFTQAPVFTQSAYQAPQAPVYRQPVQPAYQQPVQSQPQQAVPQQPAQPAPQPQQPLTDPFGRPVAPKAEDNKTAPFVAVPTFLRGH